MSLNGCKRVRDYLHVLSLAAFKLKFQLFRCCTFPLMPEPPPYQELLPVLTVSGYFTGNK